MPEQDVLLIQYIDDVEFYVGNAQPSAYYFEPRWDFTPLAYVGLETRLRDHSSSLWKQGNVRFVVTSSLVPDRAIASYKGIRGFGEDYCKALFEALEREQALRGNVQ